MSEQPKPTYNLIEFMDDLKAQDTPKTVKTSKGDIFPIINDDPPFGLILRLPLNAVSYIEMKGEFVPAAKVLMDIALGTGVYEQLANDQDEEHSLSRNEMNAFYLLILAAFDPEYTRRLISHQKNA